MRFRYPVIANLTGINYSFMMTVPGGVNRG